MAIITKDLQRIALSSRPPLNVRMQGAYLGEGAESGQGMGIGLAYTKPGDVVLRGPYETGCVEGRLCYDAPLQDFRAHRIVTVYMQEEYVAPVNLAQVAVGSGAIYGLLTDGTVVMCGSGLGMGESDCELWSDIVHLGADYGYVVGVKSDGTVQVAGYPFNGYTGGFANWEDVVAVSVGQRYCLGLTGAGTVLSATYDLAYFEDHIAPTGQWTNVTDISAKGYHVAACHADGTVSVTGPLQYSNLDLVDDWIDVIAVETLSKTTIGLKSDGTCLATGETSNNYSLVQNVGAWIGVTSISGHGYAAFGLTTEGTVIHAGQVSSLYGTPVTQWADILQLANYAGTCVGRRSCDALAYGGDSAAISQISMLDHCM